MQRLGSPVDHLLGDEQIRGKLRVSYDLLDEVSKQLFLDCACWVVQQPQPVVASAGSNRDQLEAVYGSVAVMLLQERFLMDFTQQGKMIMHDQLRDLGRDIVAGMGQVPVGLRSHIWEPANAKELFSAKDPAGTQAIWYNDGTPVNEWSKEDFKEL
jgi:hypothetical protein